MSALRSAGLLPEARHQARPSRRGVEPRWVAQKLRPHAVGSFEACFPSMPTIDDAKSGRLLANELDHERVTTHAIQPVVRQADVGELGEEQLLKSRWERHRQSVFVLDARRILAALALEQHGDRAPRFQGRANLEPFPMNPTGDRWMRFRLTSEHGELALEIGDKGGPLAGVVSEEHLQPGVAHVLTCARVSAFAVTTSLNQRSEGCNRRTPVGAVGPLNNASSLIVETSLSRKAACFVPYAAAGGRWLGAERPNDPMGARHGRC